MNRIELVHRNFKKKKQYWFSSKAYNLTAILKDCFEQKLVLTLTLVVKERRKTVRLMSQCLCTLIVLDISRCSRLITSHLQPTPSNKQWYKFKQFRKKVLKMNASLWAPPPNFRDFPCFSWTCSPISDIAGINISSPHLYWCTVFSLKLFVIHKRWLPFSFEG